jgi:hypothetical protein
MLLMLAVSNSINSGHQLSTRLLELVIVIFIFISFSATVIAIFLFYKVASIIFKRIIDKFSLLLLISIFIISPISAFAIDLLLGYLNDLDHTSNNFALYKLTSLNQRFDVQNMALDLIFNDPLILLFGIGSGRVIEFLPRAVHNGYLNILLAHGIFVYFLFCLLLYKIYNFSLRKYGNNIHVIVGFLSLLLINNFLDIFFSGLVTAYFFLINYGLSDKNKISQKAEPTSRARFLNSL